MTITKIVTITKCSSPEYWYAKLIGKDFEVLTELQNGKYPVIDGDSYIDVDDCVDKKTNVHLIEDENLGGLLREYVESDRKADVGDYIIYLIEGSPYAIPRKVTEITNEVARFEPYYDEDNDRISGYYHGSYITLDPTDIIHVDEDGNGRRYKLVDRKAEVGEKVVIINTNEEIGTKKGDVISVNRIYECGLVDVPLGAVNPKNYLVLEPAESEITTPYDDDSDWSEYDDYITVDESQASPSVVEMLGNLAVRINELERQIDVLKKRQVLDNIQTLKRGHDRLSEEIDTLHSNQKRMAEELENAKAAEFTAPTFDIDSAEVIVELAKLLARESRKVGR